MMTEEGKKIVKTIHMLGHVDRSHRRLIEAQVAKLGIHRTQHIALMYIAKNKGATQQDIASVFDISPASVAVTLKKLENADLISREKDPEDARKNRIVLTQNGEDMVKRSRELFAEVDEAMFNGFSEEETEQLRDFLDRLSKNLQDSSADGPEQN